MAMSNKHRDHIERNYRRIINALRLVIHYNAGLEQLDELNMDLKIYGENFCLAPSRFTCEENPVMWIVCQLLVCMYGDFGVSPRAGWIDDLEGALHFIEELKEGK